MLSETTTDESVPRGLAACSRMRVVCLRERGENVSVLVEKNGRAYGRDSS